MKIKLLGLAVLFLVSARPGQAQSSPGELHAQQLADRLADSLELTSPVRDSLVAINRRLHSEKMEVRNRYAPMDSIQKGIQLIENTRDSLYRPVLGEVKYQEYLARKKGLLSAY